MNMIAGAVLLAMAVVAFVRYRPPVKSDETKMMAISAWFGAITIICPMSGWLQWIGLACQIIMGSCLCLASWEARQENKTVRKNANVKGVRKNESERHSKMVKNPHGGPCDRAV